MPTKSRCEGPRGPRPRGARRCWPAPRRRARARSRSTPTPASTTTGPGPRRERSPYPGDIDMNQTAEKGYVADPVRLSGSVSQFDGEGNPLAFSALEGATADPGPRRRAASVWRSTTRRRHRRATSTWSPKTWSRDTGPTAPKSEEGFPLGGFQRVCDIAVDAEGDLWVVELPPLQDSPSTTPTAFRPARRSLQAVHDRDLQRRLQPRDRLPRQLLLRRRQATSTGSKTTTGKNTTPKATSCPTSPAAPIPTTNATTDLTHGPCLHARVEAVRRRIRPGRHRVRRERRSDHLIRDPGPRAFVPGPRRAGRGGRHAPATKRIYVPTGANTQGARHIEIFEKTGAGNRSPRSRPNPRR